ncbi:TetR/AcrR family transcriptional regulator [Nocardia sp. NBC_01377]|uniref:TetR/AcrR family transcriptional regulator n=1 Tax=Nocardia sp. NBC_01377 TaxID=2903595 RepID=UPI003245D48F
MAARDSTAKKQRRERGSLTVEDIVDSALDLAEQISVDRLSFALIGKHLNTGATSISWYFHRKNDLLDSMAGRALQRYLPAAPRRQAPPPADWRAMLRAHAHRIRDTLLANTVLCDLILVRSTPALLAAHFRTAGMDAAILGLIEAGLSTDDALDVHSALCLHVHGSVVLQRLHDKHRQPESAVGGYFDRSEITPDKTPELFRAMSAGHQLGAPDDRNFEYGLDCIVARASALVFKPGYGITRDAPPLTETASGHLPPAHSRKGSSQQ